MAHSTPPNLTPHQWAMVAEFEDRRHGQWRKTSKHIRYQRSLICSPDDNRTNSCSCRRRNCRTNCRMENHGRGADKLEDS